MTRREIVDIEPLTKSTGAGVTIHGQFLYAEVIDPHHQQKETTTMQITVDLGQLYKDCYYLDKLLSQTKDRDRTIGRMADVVKSLRDNGHTVDLQLGGLVGAMTQKRAMLFASGELEDALKKTLEAVGSP